MSESYTWRAAADRAADRDAADDCQDAEDEREADEVDQRRGDADLLHELLRLRNDLGCFEFFFLNQLFDLVVDLDEVSDREVRVLPEDADHIKKWCENGNC